MRFSTDGTHRTESPFQNSLLEYIEVLNQTLENIRISPANYLPADVRRNSARRLAAA